MADSTRQGGAKGQSLWGDSRGLSTPVTHVLTIAITGLVLIMLVSTASGFLSDQQEFAARDELDTIGNRLADDVQEVVALSEESGEAAVSIEQPDSIVGHEYRVSYESDPAACDGATHATDTCLVMSVVGMDVSQTVPLSVPSDVSLELSRSGSSFELAAEKTGAGSSSDDVVPMTRTMRVGVGQNVNTNEYGEVIDPTNRPPIPKFTLAPDFPESGDPVYFDASSSRDPDGTIIDYEWYIDGSLEHTGSETYSTSLSAGKHTVTLRVEDDEGAQATRTRRMRVSGLGYNDDFTAGAGGGSRCGGVGTEFSVTNEWSSTAKVTHLSINPAADVKNINKLEYKSGREIAFDTDGDGVWDKEYEFGSIDLQDRPDGTIVRLRSAADESDNDPVEIDPSETVTVSMCKYKGGGNAEDTTVGIRYWIDGTTNRTVVDPDQGFISSYDVEAVSGDIVVSFDSTRQLGSLDGELGNGSVSTSLSLSDFSESKSGKTYTYEASFSRSSGAYYVAVHSAEDTAGNAADSLPRNETATILGSGDYAWKTTGDWDAAQSSVGVVHQDLGDYSADSVALGRPPGSVDSSLVSYWPFDGGSSEDAVGNNDGIKHDSPTVTDGIAGTTALQFDGSDDYIEIPHDSSLEMSDDEVTVSMWVNKHRQGSGWQALLQKSDTSYNMQFDDGDDFELTIHDGDWYSAPSGSESAQDVHKSTDRFYHVVGTFDGAEVTSYVDGSLIGTNGSPDEIDDSGSHPVGIAANLDGSTGGNPDRHTRATIDDIRVYDQALSASQVKELYNVTKGSIVTDKRTGPTISKHSIDVHYDADIDSGEEIELTVYAEWKSGNVKSDSVTLDHTDDGSGTVALSGINQDADTFWVRAELRSSSPKRSPDLHGVVLEEGS